MSPSSAPTLPWTLESINKWASDEFPDAFKAANVATIHTTFEDLTDESELRNVASSTPFKRPFVNKILQVGHIDSFFKLYVFICGEKRNLIDFMFKLDGPDCFSKLSFPHYSTSISTEYPFSRFDHTDTLSTARRKLRDFVVYLFVARGLLDEVEYFSAFPDEFKWACEWILYNPETPQLLQITSFHTKHTNQIPANHKDPQDDEEVFFDAAKLEELSNEHSRPLKRRQGNDSNESDRIRRRRVKEPSFFNLQEQIANKYADIKKSDDDLSTKNAMMVQKRNICEQKLAQRNESFEWRGRRMWL